MTGPELRRSLERLDRNLAFSWLPAVRDLFRDLDPVDWDEADHNPIVLLAGLSDDRLERAAEDEALVARVAEAEARGASVATRDTLKSMGLSRAASALGVAVALGELDRAQLNDAGIGNDWSLYSGRASCSAGGATRSRRSSTTPAAGTTRSAARAPRRATSSGTGSTRATSTRAAARSSPRRWRGGGGWRSGTSPTTSTSS